MSIALQLIQKKIDWIFENLLNCLQELRADCSVNDAMIARHGYAHRAAHDNLSILRDRSGGHRADRQDRALGWINHSGEFVNSEHSQIADRKRRAGIFLGP